MSDSTVPDMACRVCFEPINRFFIRGVAEWRHAQVDVEYDHDPDPVPRLELPTVNYVCDFCCKGGIPVEWVYPTRQEMNLTLAAATTTNNEVRRNVGRRRYSPATGRKEARFEQVGPEAGAPRELQENRLSDTWAACGPCTRFVEIGDVERLVTHVRRVKPESHGKAPRRLLRDSYNEFFAQRLPRIPVAEFIAQEKREKAVSDATPESTAPESAEAAEPQRCTMCSDPIRGTPLAVMSITFSNGVEETQIVDTEDCMESVSTQWRDYVREPGVAQL